MAASAAQTKDESFFRDEIKTSSSGVFEDYLSPFPELVDELARAMALYSTRISLAATSRNTDRHAQQELKRHAVTMAEIADWLEINLNRNVSVRTRVSGAVHRRAREHRDAEVSGRRDVARTATYLRSVLDAASKGDIDEDPNLPIFKHGKGRPDEYARTLLKLEVMEVCRVLAQKRKIRTEREVCSIASDLLRVAGVHVSVKRLQNWFGGGPK